MRQPPCDWALRRRYAAPTTALLFSRLDASVSRAARLTIGMDEQRESRGAVGASLLRGRAKAPSSWLLGLLLRVLARASVRAAEWRTRDRGRRLSQGGMRIRAGVPPGAVRLESSRYGPGCDFACAVSDPEPSPRPHREVRKRSFARVLRYETWIDRGTTSSTAVQRSRHHVVYGGAARRSYGQWGHWDFVWDFAHFRWRVVAPFVAQTCDKK